MRLRLKKNILIIILLLFISGFIYSSVHIISWVGDNKKTKDIRKGIDNSININVDKGIFEVDFDELSKINSDVNSYLIVHNTNINYPVVKTNNNDYYLSHSFDRSKSEAGWVFMDSNNKFDGTDKNIIIYGHNRLDGTMFGTLKRVLNKDWNSNEDNLEIELINKEETIKYRIFSMYKIKEEEYYITTDFDNNSFNNFINKIKKRSIHDFNVKDDINEILTLSTCTIVDGYRLVVHAYKE